MKNRGVYEFIALIILSSLLSYIISDFLVTEDLIYESLSDRLSDRRIEELLNMRQERSWYGYLFLPIKYSLQFLLISVSMYTGAFFFNYKISFSALYKICIRAEFIFLIPTAIKLFWFLFIQTNYDLSDLGNFAPLSLFNLFPSGDHKTWFSFLLKSVNIFELLYILFIAFEFSYTADKTFSKALKMVTISYGIAWMLWITFALFLIVSFS